MSFAWMNRASCRSEDPELFFAADGERAAEREVREENAREVCRRCPVMRDCAEYAVTTWQRAGIWGGLDPDQIYSERRKRMRKAAA